MSPHPDYVAHAEQRYVHIPLARNRPPNKARFLKVQSSHQRSPFSFLLLAFSFPPRLLAPRRARGNVASVPLSAAAL